jgi:hypothetical protein
MLMPSTSTSPKSSRRRRRRVGRSPFPTITGAQASPHPPKVRATLDVLVVRGSSLRYGRTRSGVIARIDQLASRTARSRGCDRGPWVLVFTNSNLEAELGRQLGRALVTRCQGTVVVTEGGQENSARAALALHRLHFPGVPERERAARILVLGSTRERELLCDQPPMPYRGTRAVEGAGGEL